MGVIRQFNRILGERMAASGRMAMIEVVGRRSGRRLRTPVGYVANDDGSVWLGAGRAEAQWARNLLATPACRVRIGVDERGCEARQLTGEERTRAIAAIHAKYGAPAARVGTGPVFELRPAAERGNEAIDDAATREDAGAAA
ncbi:MAG TPA: nitroreductase family deazaflavin-dependent oxidoreductase [Candidatus Limnocylindrales bacterium]|nr:nitroreductase family deazaflavin-dependent oxidoreductase [Candidatus Limnocylindrales bacterium]